MSEEKKRYSKSKFNQYTRCPLSYKYSYVDKISKGKTNKWAERGKILHEFFEKFYDKLPDPEKIVDPTKEFMKASEELIDELKIDEEYDCTPHIKNFVRLNKRIYDKLKEKGEIQYFKPIAVEWKQYDEEDDFVGIIDAVFKFNDKILLLDYKTTNYKPGKESGYRFELALYIKLWNKFNPENQVTHWGIYFSGNDVLWTEPIKKRSINHAKKKTDKIRKDIEDEKFDPGKNPPCAWCDFFWSCYVPR